MDKKKIFIGLGIFWIIILGGFIGFKEFTIQTGEKVLFKTLPVDPRDLFRGDYVILQYDMSRIDFSQFPGSPVFTENDALYAEIEKDKDGYGKVVRLFKESPKGKLFLRGTVKYVSGTNIRVDYGIESYFVPAGKGYFIEERRGKDVDAQISIDNFGNGIIKTILIGGEEVNFEIVKVRN